MDNSLDPYFERQGDALVVWPTLFQRGWVIQNADRPAIEAKLRQRQRINFLVLACGIAVLFPARIIYDVSLWWVFAGGGLVIALNWLPIRFPASTPRTVHNRSPIDAWRAQARSDPDLDARQIFRLSGVLALMACLGLLGHPEEAGLPFMILAGSALNAVRYAVIATEQRHLCHVKHSDASTPTSDVSSVQG